MLSAGMELIPVIKVFVNVGTIQDSFALLIQDFLFVQMVNVFAPKRWENLNQEMEVQEDPACRLQINVISMEVATSAY